MEERPLKLFAGRIAGGPAASLNRYPDCYQGYVFEEFEEGVTLRDVVTDILRDGHASISQVGKALRERGIKMHRLAVAGYLKALADGGYLEEREVPPAKTYRLRPGRATRSLYEVVGERSGQTAAPADAVRLTVQTLVDLFHRPVFREELKRAGYAPGPGLEEVTGEERQAARRALSGTPLKLPFNDPAYRPEYRNPDDRETLTTASHHVIAGLVRDTYSMQAMAQVTKQARLTEVG